jgi:hypothetical protein
MDLDDIKAQLDRIFASRPGAASREETSGLRQALLDFKIGIGELREAQARTEAQLGAARRDGEDYERRGRLAAGIQDAETVRLAEEFGAKAREKIDLLERKLLVQRDEVAMAEREYDLTKQRFQSAKMGIPDLPGLEDVTREKPAAAASGEPPSVMEEYLLDQRAREAAVEAQLAHLKKKLGDRG